MEQLQEELEKVREHNRALVEELEACAATADQGRASVN